MQHFRSLKDIQVQDAWLTIGSFDGIHSGHQEILRRLTSGAHAVNAPAIVLTFYPHPAVVLGKRKKAQYLTTPDEQAELLAALDVDYLITHPFTQDVAAQTARHFLSRVKNHLGLRQLWVGHDFAMGHNRAGDVPMLHRLGIALGFQVQVVPPVLLEGEIVSSSYIRSLLKSGKLNEANRLLGRSYSLRGQVVQGQGRAGPRPDAGDSHGQPRHFSGTDCAGPWRLCVYGAHRLRRMGRGDKYRVSSDL